MTFIKRFLLILPIVLFAILHYWAFNPDEQAYGLAHFFLKGLFIFLFLIAITTSYLAIFVPQHRRIAGFEMLLYTIFSGSLLTMIYTLTLRGHTSGEIWLVAESGETGNSQTLTLKENGNFTISLSSADFGVDYSGKFVKNSDTVFLDRTIVKKTNEKVFSTYVVHDSTLTPLTENSHFAAFKIKTPDNCAQ